MLLDGKVVGDLDRNKGTTVMLPARDGGAVLDILVQGIGRDNAGAAFDTKGLQSEEVRLDGKAATPLAERHKVMHGTAADTRTCRCEGSL